MQRPGQSDVQLRTRVHPRPDLGRDHPFGVERLIREERDDDDGVAVARAPRMVPAPPWQTTARTCGKT